jgi:deazaflavin-dependent oxidoreductase (nitroreductase family)
VPTLTAPLKGVIGRIAGSGPFAAIAPTVVPRVDRVLSRLTGGRFVVSGLLLPSLVLNHIGAKTGQSRTTPLATLPDGDSFYVVGSNFGRANHPAWTANLIAHPDVSATFRGRTVDLRAHLLTDEEKAAIWPKLTKLWPTYDTYVERSGRNLRVFRLDPR